MWLLDRWGTFFVVVALTHPLELLFRRHEAASRIDGLTGAANQQYFRELLDREINRSARSGGTFSVALVDCDDFRLINDEFGNVVGDAVLRTIADAITKCIRRSDTAARLGGDEFAILLPDSTIDNAREIVQRLRGKLLEHKLNDWTITLSIGLASFQGSRLDAEGIIAFCDSLMDRAKRSGKGQIAAEQAPDVPDDADATSLGRRTPEVSISRRTGQ
ncbi:MAG: GGDEF domain-containing protein [Betaproteobacteria bacterium]|nr:GGDEF domain-containing protein [Betaproteobacteria bacterium]